jgi:hypothetical protein
MVDLDAFRRAVRTRFDEIDREFDGEYAEELRTLAGISQAEIDAITPDSTDVATYKKLMAVVEAASRHNVQAAELRQQIQALGAVAVKIVTEKAPALARKVGLGI